MVNKLIYTLLLLIPLLFTSCGSDENDVWGIDNDSGILLPTCNGDKTTTTNATRVYEGYSIEPIMENTEIYMWHFQDTTKLACVATGKAIMKDL